MIPVILYLLLISCFFGGIAFLIDRALIGTRISRRSLWFAAMLLSVSWPAVSLLRGEAGPTAAAGVSEQAGAPAIRIEQASSGEALVIDASDTAVPNSDGVQWAFLNQLQPAVPETRDTLNTILVWGWVISCVLVLLFYLLCALNLYHASKYWQTTPIDGRDVLVSEQIGPAMYGLLQPQIVFPKWLLDVPQGIQHLVVRHEQAHINGRDHWLLYTGILLAIAMPWNPVIWWQMFRLKDAIESDCDLRVLSNGTDAIEYSEALLVVSQKRFFSPMMSVALIEPASKLELRITRLLDQVRASRTAVASAVFIVPMLLVSAIAVESPELQFGETATLVEELTEGDEMKSRNLLPALLAAGVAQASDIDPEFPAGWQEMLGTGPAWGAGPVRLPNICETGVDTTLGNSGEGNFTVRCSQSEPGGGGVIQRFSAEPYRGKRVRFSANIQAQDIRDVPPPELLPGFNFAPDPEVLEQELKGMGGLYVRVGVNTASTLVRDDMSDRPIQGSMGWAPYEVVVDVPEEAAGIVVGFWMQGQGQIWMSGMAFEEVGTNVPVTAEVIEQGPQNLNLR